MSIFSHSDIHGETASESTDQRIKYQTELRKMNRGQSYVLLLIEFLRIFKAICVTPQHSESSRLTKNLIPILSTQLDGKIRCGPPVGYSY